MKILDLKEGNGIKFETKADQDRIIPLLHLFGYSYLSGDAAMVATRLTGAPLYVSIEKGKKLVYTSGPNFQNTYIFARQLQTPLQPFVEAHTGSVVHGHHLKRTSIPVCNVGKENFTAACTETVFEYKYIVEPNNGLKLLRNLKADRLPYFSKLWGESILNNKGFQVTESDKMKYLRECGSCAVDVNKHYFVPIKLYKDMELILVKHFQSNTWMQRFFYKMDVDGGVWCYGIGCTTPSKYEFHCKAKVTPA